MSTSLGERGVKLAEIFAVISGVCVSTVSVLRFGRFLAGFSSPSNFGNLEFYHKVLLNWILACSCLYLPSLTGSIIRKVGTLRGLPDCYFKFIKIVLLSSILNGVIVLWQAVPELCLWNLNNINNAENIFSYLHCLMWILLLMIMLAIDVSEITGLKSIFYSHLTNGNCCSLKSRQFDRLLSNMGLPGSSCLIIILWAQKVMSFDRFLLAVVWTLGLISCNQTDEEDIKYVAKQIEKKRLWMFYYEKVPISPLK